MHTANGLETEFVPDVREWLEDVRSAVAGEDRHTECQPADENQTIVADRGEETPNDQNENLVSLELTTSEISRDVKKLLDVQAKRADESAEDSTKYLEDRLRRTEQQLDELWKKETLGEQDTEDADDSLGDSKQAKPVNQQQTTGAPVDQDTDDPEDPDGEHAKQADNGKDDQPFFSPSLSEAVGKALAFFNKEKPEKGLTVAQEFILVIAFYKHRYPSLSPGDIRDHWIETYERHQGAYRLSEKGRGKKVAQANHVHSYIAQKLEGLLTNLPERR
jgi:hypothetical protein